MRYLLTTSRELWVSLAAAAATPVAMYAAAKWITPGFFGGGPPPGLAIVPVCGFLFVLGVCIWRPIHPLVYGLALTPCFVVTLYFLADRSSNFFGLGALALVVFGMVIGTPAALFALWLRPRSRVWLPPVAVAFAFLLGLVAQRQATATSVTESAAIVEDLRTIWRAERAYADSHPDHTFTCNGPDLPGLATLAWRSSPLTSAKNEALLHGFWIHLECPGLQRVPIHAYATWQNGPRFEMDSNGRIREGR